MRTHSYVEHALREKAQLNTDPVFAPEAQEVFAHDCRVYAVTATECVREGAEGVYRGHLRERRAVVDWDTPDGNGYRESVPFAAIRNLYR